MNEDKKILEAIEKLTASLNDVSAKMSTVLAKMEDLINNDQRHMIENLNGSLQELNKELKRRKDV